MIPTEVFEAFAQGDYIPLMAQAAMENAAVISGPFGWPSIELYTSVGVSTVSAPTKGHAVRTIAATRPEAPILYIGDDTTDEDAFAVLGPHDFAVLVDDERARAERPREAVSHARYVVNDTDDVARIVRILGIEASCPV